MKPPSLRTTISLSAARSILLRVAVVAAGCDQASSRSAPSSHQVLPLPLTQWWGLLGLECGDLPFDSVHDLQRLVPAALQLAGD